MQLRIASFAFLLSVAPTASTVQIRKAYFCLRSDIYQTLQPSDENNAFNNNLPLPNRQQVVLTKEEKRSASSIRCRIIRAMFDLRKFICGCRGNRMQFGSFDSSRYILLSNNQSGVVTQQPNHLEQYLTCNEGQ